MPCEFRTLDGQSHRLALTGRAARAVRGTADDWLLHPGEVLQRLQGHDFDLLCELIRHGLQEPDSDVDELIDAIPADQWAVLAEGLFQEVLSFFRPEVRDQMSAFLRELNQKRQTILAAIQAELGGTLPSNSSEKPESTSTPGPSETSSPSPEAAAAPHGPALPA